MLKKTLAAAGIAGLLIFGSASAALADSYPPSAPVTASDNTVTPGTPVTITATGLGDYEFVTFSVTPPTGATLSSIVLLASAPGASVTKPVVNGTASATLTPTVPGTYTVSVAAPDGTVLGSTVVSVAAAPAPSPSGGAALPPTGGAVPAAAIWAGVGAVGLGGIAAAAAAARRRTQKS